MAKLTHVDKSCRLQISQDRTICRPVSDIDEVKKIIGILEKLNLIGDVVIDTKISDMDNFVEHPFLFPIIQSCEYTLSMAYDVSELSLELSLKLIKEKLYSFDLLPHNFSFIDGKWILFDFGSISLSPQRVKTQIRGFFEISILSFELEKFLSRKETKHYFLNRYKTKFVFSMFPFYITLIYFVRSTFAKVLSGLGFHFLAYKYMLNLLKKYKKKHNRPVLSLSIAEKENQIFKLVDSLISGLDVSTVFCVGELSSKFALVNNKKSSFLYIDDYDICDEYYNYIVENAKQKLSCGVLYPLVFDETIPQNVNYRALFDDFEQERYSSDLVVALDLNEFHYNEQISLIKYIEYLTHFSKKSLILKLDKTNYSLLEEIKSLLFSLYKIVNVYSEDEFIIVIAYEKQVQYVSTSEFSYFNYNRGFLSSKQSQKIIEILQSKKIK